MERCRGTEFVSKCLGKKVDQLANFEENSNALGIAETRYRSYARDCTKGSVNCDLSLPCVAFPSSL